MRLRNAIGIAAVLLFALLGSAASARASCGDYLPHFDLPYGGLTHGNLTDGGGSWQSAAALDPSPFSAPEPSRPSFPCDGPTCQRAPLPAPPPAPPSSASSSQGQFWAILLALDDCFEPDNCRACGEARLFSVAGYPPSIDRPPR
jgi:hypothetical protein